MKQRIYLFDLPTYPKGVLSLSLPAVAGCFPPQEFDVSIIDLNFYGADYVPNLDQSAPLFFIGLKVSAQNFKYAKALSARLKKAHPAIPLIWGGELPTLLPDSCLQYADIVIQSMFETVAHDFIADLKAGAPKKIYTGSNNYPLSHITSPNLSAVSCINDYYSFMGLPLETSRGCTETCSFCMVHVMQKKNYNQKSKEQLRAELSNYKGRYVNVVDYNIGVDAGHVIAVAEVMKESAVNGWMAEMCIEMLDNDMVLKALSESGCRIIYCGLEAIDEGAIKSIHKMNTNHIENYERIIKKAQSYGVQIAAGIILAIDNTHESTFENLFRFFQRTGIIYAKLTFLTYNPGAKVQHYMQKKGAFTTEEVELFDGNHLSYLPNGVNADVVYKGAEQFIRRFYSLSGIISRSLNVKMGLAKRLEYVLFNLCYRNVYLSWLGNNIFYSQEGFNALIETPFKKGFTIKFAEYFLKLLRKP